MPVTLRDLIPQTAAVRILNNTDGHEVGTDTTFRKRFLDKMYAKIGRIAFYKLSDLGLDNSVAPDDLPAIPLDGLMTSAQMAQHLGWSYQWLIAQSDYNGGPLRTVSPYGVGRLWIVDTPTKRVRRQCAGITASGTRCLRMVSGDKCKTHS